MHQLEFSHIGIRHSFLVYSLHSVEHRVNSELDSLQGHSPKELVKNVDTISSFQIMVGIIPQGVFQLACRAGKLLTRRNLKEKKEEKEEEEEKD